uniref:G-protein coupled receptors family 1 profile domain-containing protein n=1 Tax=Daphnia galeata TaxID=27404 RepID=A0A8J2WM08_9CRUS|nr:unnamed protein product [Daphnia galeata]
MSAEYQQLVVTNASASILRDIIPTSTVESSHHQFTPFQIEHPLYNSQVLFIFRVLVIAIGIPIQILVAFVILRTRQLNNPRNAFWLGNITCHFVTLLMGAYEYWTVVNPTIHRSDILCRIYSLLVGYPYTILLVSLLLATADRWFAISDPIKHRKYVTVSGVAGCLIISWILVLFILTSPYWSGTIEILLCAVNQDVMKWIMASHFVMVSFIIVAQVKVYIRTRQYLRFKAHRPAANLHQQSPPDYYLSSNSSSNTRPDEYFVHLPNKTICRLELEASVTLFCGVASLCVCALPLAFVFLTLIVCKIELCTFQCDVSTVLILIPYARELLLLHSVVSPLLYVVRSREFSKALRRTLPRCFFFHQQRRCASPVELRNY